MKEFFQEVQSKWIYRVAGGYIVSAWVILQVSAIVFPSLELPSWTMKVVLEVLVLGFVPALFSVGTSICEEQERKGLPC